jgi:hypothetical protein
MVPDNVHKAIEIGVCKCGKEVELKALVNKCKCGELNMAKNYAFIPHMDIDKELEELTWE